MTKHETTECTERNRNSLCSQEKHSLKSITGRIVISSVCIIRSRDSIVVAPLLAGRLLRMSFGISQAVAKGPLLRGHRERKKNVSGVVDTEESPCPLWLGF
jgi:hypothetical protein